MAATSFTNLAIVLTLAFAARLILGLMPKLPIPGVVAEIVLGIIAGPAVLGIVKADEPVALLATIGVAFVLFLAGLEVDVAGLRGPKARLAAGGFAASIVLALIVGAVLTAIGVVSNSLLVAITLLATSLGLVVPVLSESHQLQSSLGQFVIASASLGDFGAVIALSLAFSRDSSSTSSRLVLLGAFAVSVALIGLSLMRSGRSMKIAGVLNRLQDTTAQIRVRGALALLAGLLVLAQHTGLETILGAFVAGVLVGTLDHDGMANEHLRHKLDAVGYGLLIPVFFVASGIRFDLRALTNHPAVLARVPLFVAALVIVRGVPALLYRHHLDRRSLVAAGLLQSTSLPFIVTATTIGVEIKALSSANAAALVAAGLVSALVFPAVAVTLTRERVTASPALPEPVATTS